MTEPQHLLASDEQQEAPVQLHSDEAIEGEPYGLTALLGGLALLLLAHGVLPNWVVWQHVDRFWRVFLLYDGALLAAAGIYFTLLITRTRLPLVGLCIASGILGLLVSLPASNLYLAPWKELDSFTTLLVQMLGAGLGGFLLAKFLHVEERPQLVAIISFLFIFVLVSIYFILGALWAGK